MAVKKFPDIGEAGRTPTDLPNSLSSTHLAAQQFSNHVNKHGGATMNVHTGKLLQPGESGYVVGGEPNKSGGRVPTGYTPNSQMGAGAVLHHWANVKEQTSGPNVNLGAWKDKGNTEFDASSVYHDRRQATDMGKQRAEKAIWDNANMKEIDTSSDESAKRVNKDLGK